MLFLLEELPLRLLFLLQSLQARGIEQLSCPSLAYRQRHHHQRKHYNRHAENHPQHIKEPRRNLPPQRRRRNRIHPQRKREPPSSNIERKLPTADTRSREKHPHESKSPHDQSGKEPDNVQYLTCRCRRSLQASGLG